MFVDTHCHLNIMTGKEPEALLGDSDYPIISDIIDQARRVGVEKIINVGTSLPESENSIQIARRFSGVYATVGVHPCDANNDQLDLHLVIKKIREWLKYKDDHKIVGVGETGLDFYHKPYNQQRQIDFFRAQMECALEYNMPLVVHVRDAGDELLRVLEEYVKNGVRGVIHCFGQKLDFAQQVLAWGFYVGLDGPIGYPKNQWLRDIIKIIPLQQIILETDAPFLPPQQFRGKQNSPIHIPLIARIVADIQEIALNAVEDTTTLNAQKLFMLRGM